MNQEFNDKFLLCQRSLRLAIKKHAGIYTTSRVDIIYEDGMSPPKEGPFDKRRCVVVGKDWVRAALSAELEAALNFVWKPSKKITFKIEGRIANHKKVKKINKTITVKAGATCLDALEVFFKHPSRINYDRNYRLVQHDADTRGKKWAIFVSERNAKNKIYVDLAEDKP